MSSVNTNYMLATQYNYAGRIESNRENCGTTEFSKRTAEKKIQKEAVQPKDMTLDEYKAYFNEKMNGLYTHPSQRGMNWVIDITDAAYKKMQSDPEYEKKILDALEKNKTVDFGGNIPVIAYTHIDDTYEKCYGYTQGMKENDSYAEKIAKAEQERSRLAKAWSSERQMAKASSAYEANVVMENSPLG